MRSTIANDRACSYSNQPNALAAIYYNDANPNTRPNSTMWPTETDQGLCENDPLTQTVPLYSIPADLNPSVMQELDFSWTMNETGHQVWTVNDSGFRANYNHPILDLAASGNTSYPWNPEWNVYNMGQNRTVRVVMYNNSTMYHVSTPLSQKFFC